MRVVHARAEDYLASNWVDLVLIRAVSSVRENVRKLRRSVTREGCRDAQGELVGSRGRAEREAERLGFKLDTVLEHELPDEMGSRAMVVYRAPGGDGL